MYVSLIKLCRYDNSVMFWRLWLLDLFCLYSRKCTTVTNTYSNQVTNPSLLLYSCNLHMYKCLPVQKYIPHTHTHTNLWSPFVNTSTVQLYMHSIHIHTVLNMIDYSTLSSHSNTVVDINKLLNLWYEYENELWT